MKQFLWLLLTVSPLVYSQSAPIKKHVFSRIEPVSHIVNYYLDSRIQKQKEILDKLINDSSWTCQRFSSRYRCRSFQESAILPRELEQKLYQRYRTSSITFGPARKDSELINDAPALTEWISFQPVIAKIAGETYLNYQIRILRTTSMIKLVIKNNYSDNELWINLYNPELKLMKSSRKMTGNLRSDEYHYNVIFN